jgi:hypothetical protein
LAVTIEQLVKQRGINFVLHFTRADHLESILENGLLPNNQFEQYAASPTVNDTLRLDGCTNASCVSIGFPNYKMFYSCRQKDKAVHWVVLAMPSSILWEKECAFCVENAASSAVTSIPLAARRTAAAFNRMYDEFPGKPTRAQLGISNALPTNPQAEVLMFERIEPELIGGVAFNSQEVLQKYSPLGKGRQMKLIPGLFGPRVDYPHWKK